VKDTTHDISFRSVLVIALVENYTSHHDFMKIFLVPLCSLVLQWEKAGHDSNLLSTNLSSLALQDLCFLSTSSSSRNVCT
jgi:hypothetical protein